MLQFVEIYVLGQTNSNSKTALPVADMSKRISLTVPDSVFRDLQAWAEAEGRPLANLAAHLLQDKVRKLRADASRDQ